MDEAVVDEARRERAGPLRAADEGVVHLGEAEKEVAAVAVAGGVEGVVAEEDEDVDQGEDVRRGGARDRYVVHVASGREPRTPTVVVVVLGGVGEAARGRFRRGDGGAGRRDGICVARRVGRCLVLGFHAEHVVQRVEGAILGRSLRVRVATRATKDRSTSRRVGRDRESARGATRARTHSSWGYARDGAHGGGDGEAGHRARGVRGARHVRRELVAFL